MATTYVWTGVTSSSFATATNFTPNGNPITGDTVIFNSGSVSVTAGLNQAAVTLANMYVTKDYAGTLGNSVTDPFIISVSGDLKISGGATHYIKAGTAPIARCRVLGVGTSGLAYAYLLGGTGGITLLYLERGKVQIYSGTVAQANIQAKDGNAANATLELLNGNVTTLYAAQGNLALLSTGAGAINSLVHVNGTTDWEGTGAIAYLYLFGGIVNANSTAGITSIAQIHGGLLDYSDNAAPGTIAELQANGGTVDLRNGRGGPTITTQQIYAATVIT